MARFKGKRAHDGTPMTRQSMIALLALLGAAGLAAQSSGSASARVERDVRTLAADSMEGRGLGTRGLELARRYIGESFRAIGLEHSLHAFTVSPDAPAAAHAGVGGVTGRNVVAVRRGAIHPEAYVVIGAHYDHLGRGGFGSLDPDSTGVVHNGADDNASGTAALLEAARLVAERPAPARSVAFVAFSGEELGLLGSSSFVRDAPIPIDSIYAMVNLDMVGRLREERLSVFGAASAVEFPPLLDSLNASRGFMLSASGDGYGRSDHASFYGAGRPVLHFFTGTHEDYHRTSDDWDRLNVEGIASVAGFVADLALVLANRAEPLTFVEAAPPPSMAGGGYGAYLGTVPDMSENPGGVRLTGVRAGSPADVAGLRAGDVIIKIGEHEVADLYDMTDALRAHEPGDTVWLVARRGDAELRLLVTFGRRGG